MVEKPGRYFARYLMNNIMKNHARRLQFLSQEAKFKSEKD